MQPAASSGENAEKPALEAFEVCAGYPGGRKRDSSGDILHDVSMRVFPGEMVAVIGPNGAGKSTLVRALGGALAPRTGRILLRGQDLSALSRREIAAHLSVVHQSSDPGMGFRVGEIVMMGRAPHQGALKIPTQADHQAVDDALARAGIAHLSSRSVAELSGGERQLVGIARALAQAASVLVLDEASAHLDIRHAVALYELALREVSERRVACLAVMHDLNLAAAYAHRVILMKEGRIEASGSVDEVMTYRRLRDAFDVDLYVGLNELDQTRYFVPRKVVVSLG